MQISSTISRVSLIFWIIFTCQSLTAALPAVVDGQPLPSLAPMLENVQDAVVNISTTTEISYREHPLMQDPFFRRFFGVPDQPSRRKHNNSLGSGVIVDAQKGYIITNHHVIDKADKITVTLKDGRKLDGNLMGSDPDSDIALIQVKAKELIAIKLGDADELRVGDFVVAIGSPFGLSQTVSSGIISALGRSGLGIEGYEDFIQTDASINPGNSGGALVNLRGELIGINTAIYSRSGGSIGIGFSIPVDMVAAIKNQIIEYGSVKRGKLGIEMQDLTPALADAFGLRKKKGAVIIRVVEGSGAKDAGLEEGDVVVNFNDTVIENSADLRNAIGLVRPDSTVRIHFYRDGRLKKHSVTIKEDTSFNISNNTIGSRLSGAKFKKEGDIIVVAEVMPDSPASYSGLEQDDIILTINRKRITSVKQLEETLSAARTVLVIKLIRNGRGLLLTLQN